MTGNISFTSAQSTVADVSGTSGISSFDAALIARYVAALGAPTGSTGSWIFNPANYTHASITSSLTEDYSALLMGEISGNWTDAPRPAEAANGLTQSVEIDAPHLTTSANKEIVIPIAVQQVKNKGIISYEFDLRYDPLVMQPQSDPVDLAGTVSRGLFAVVNASEPGLLRVVMYGPLPIDNDGILLNLRFNAVGSTGSASALTLERFVLNEGDIPLIVTDGRIDISYAEDQSN